jgi:hypothetical protein
VADDRREASKAEMLERAYDEIDRLQTELENLRGRQVDRIAQLESELGALGVKAQKGASLAATVRSIVDQPLMGRADVQSNLLVALERYDGRR